VNEFYVVSFDITDEHRLRCVSNELENFGTRVQRSVFECWLHDAELDELKTRLRNLIEKEQDQVRYYPLCPKDLPRILIDGTGEVTPNPAYFTL